MSSLNECPQFVTEIDGQRIHYGPAGSAEPIALPLIRPPRLAGVGSRVPRPDRVTDRPPPARRRAGEALDLVIPSPPGHGFPAFFHHLP
jgi:hypothetical protein